MSVVPLDVDCSLVEDRLVQTVELLLNRLLLALDFGNPLGEDSILILDKSLARGCLSADLILLPSGFLRLRAMTIEETTRISPDQS